MSDKQTLDDLSARAFGDAWEVVGYGDGDSLVIHHDRDNRVCFMSTHGGSRTTMDRIEASAAFIVALVNAYRRGDLVVREPVADVVEALEKARAALSNYACHAGDAAPCIRSAYQCATECGRAAGDVILDIDTTLSRYRGEA